MPTKKKPVEVAEAAETVEFQYKTREFGLQVDKKNYPEKVPALSMEEPVRILKACASKYVASKSGGVGGDNAVYGTVLVDGSWTFYRHPCHAYLKSQQDNKTFAVWSVMCKPRNDEAYPKIEEAVRPYFDWITGPDSPWRLLFEKYERGVTIDEEHTTSQEFMWNYGFVFFNVKEIPSNLLMNFLVATRMPKEWPEFILKWHRWVKMGYDPSVAFSLVTAFGPSGATSGTSMPLESVNFTLAGQDKYDWPLDLATYDVAAVESFTSFKPVRFERPFFEYPNSTPINALWGKNSSTSGQIPFNKENYSMYLYETYSGKYGKDNKDAGPVYNQNTYRAEKPGPVRRWTLNTKELDAIVEMESIRLRAKQQIPLTEEVASCAN